MTVQVIIRIDDVADRYDLMELKEWFISKFPKIPIICYIEYSQYSFRWRKKAWETMKHLITSYNWEIGGHTRNHHHLSRLPQEKLENEIIKNIQDIENGLNSVGLEYKITSFAYPYGDFDERVKKVLAENEVVYGLTYVNEDKYKTQLSIPKNNLYEISVSCNATNSVGDWNKRFKEVYDNGDTYVLCLHTPHWGRARNKSNLKRVFKSYTIKELYYSTRRFFQFILKKSSLNRWKMLENHLNFILKHSDVHFITFKDL